MLPKVLVYNGFNNLRYMLFEDADVKGISGPLKQFGAYEAYALIPSAALINKGLKGNTVLDIGANLGTYAIPLAKNLPNLKFGCLSYSALYIINFVEIFF